MLSLRKSEALTNREVDKLKVCKLRSDAHGYAQRLRQEKGLTQEQVEERSGSSQQYLSGLERGKRNPSIVTLYEIAQALGVSHVEFVLPIKGENYATTGMKKPALRRVFSFIL